MPTSGVPLSDVTVPLIRVGLAASAGPATSMVELTATATAKAAPPSFLYRCMVLLPTEWHRGRGALVTVRAGRGPSGRTSSALPARVLCVSSCADCVHDQRRWSRHPFGGSGLVSQRVGNALPASASAVHP